MHDLKSLTVLAKLVQECQLNILWMTLDIHTPRRTHRGTNVSVYVPFDLILKWRAAAAFSLKVSSIIKDIQIHEYS